MPETQVVIYCEEDGKAPLLEWLDSLTEKAQLKCLAKIERLKQEGHASRRPDADFLRDKIYELRVGLNGINYRMLYFFHGNVATVVSYGIIINEDEIDRAIERMKKLERDPEKHTYQE